MRTRRLPELHDLVTLQLPDHACGSDMIASSMAVCVDPSVAFLFEQCLLIPTAGLWGGGGIKGGITDDREYTAYQIAATFLVFFPSLTASSRE